LLPIIMGTKIIRLVRQTREPQTQLKSKKEVHRKHVENRKKGRKREVNP